AGCPAPLALQAQVERNQGAAAPGAARGGPRGDSHPPEEGLRHPGRGLDPRCLEGRLRRLVLTSIPGPLGRAAGRTEPGPFPAPPGGPSRSAQAPLDAGDVPALAAPLVLRLG